MFKSFIRHCLLAASLIAIFVASQSVSAKSVAKGKGKASAPASAPAAVEEEAVDESLNPSLVVNAPESAALAIESSGQAAAATTAAAPEGLPTEEVSKAEINKLPENQIPVLANAKNAKKAEASAANRIFITLGVLTVLLGAALFYLKRWNARKGMDRKHTQIKILTQHVIGPKKSLAIVQVAGESILIGITDHNISMLKSLSLLDEDIPEATPKNFNSALDGFDEDFQEEPVRSRTMSTRDSLADDEDFSIRGLGEIRDVVTRRFKGTKNQ